MAWRPEAACSRRQENEVAKTLSPELLAFPIATSPRDVLPAQARSGWYLQLLSALQKPVENMAEDTREQLKQLLLEKSVRTGEFTLASGKKSDLYVDCRVTSFDARGARLIGEAGWALVQERLQSDGLSAAGIGGMTLGADPISLAIGMESARQQPDDFLQVFTVRKEAKQYGAGRRIEGNFRSGDAIVVVDDVITTGGSTLKAIDAIESEGGTVLFAFVLVDREEGGRQALEDRGIKVVSLFTRTDLIGTPA